MIKIKLKRKLWFYPHRCPDCGKVLVFTRHHDQVRCRKCGKKQQRRNKAAKLGISLNKMKKQRWTHYGQSRYNSIRKECLEIGYCQLCGTTDNLTCHHVGGGSEHYTCLCKDCHEQYESYANRWKHMRVKLALIALRMKV